MQARTHARTERQETSGRNPITFLLGENRNTQKKKKYAPIHRKKSTPPRAHTAFVNVQTERERATSPTLLIMITQRDCRRKTKRRKRHARTTENRVRFRETQSRHASHHGAYADVPRCGVHAHCCCQLGVVCTRCRRRQTTARQTRAREGPWTFSECMALTFSLPKICCAPLFRHWWLSGKVRKLPRCPPVVTIPRGPQLLHDNARHPTPAWPRVGYGSSQHTRHPYTSRKHYEASS